MLLNQDRAARILDEQGIDAIVACSPENVMYATDYECVTHWINKGFQLYSVFSPAHSPNATLIAPGLELDAIVDGDVWVDDVYLFSDFKRGRASRDKMDETGRKGAELAARAPLVPTALDGLVAALEARGLKAGRIAVDENGMSEQALGSLRRRLPNATIEYGTAIWWEIRMVKTPAEIARIERATGISEQAIRNAFSLIEPGVTERELIDAYHREIAAMGAKPSFCVIGSGSRSSYPHALASDRKIEEGDIVRYDIGCTYKYYHSDNARAVTLGAPDDEKKRIWNALAAGVNEATAAVKPGAQPGELFDIAMAPARKLGLDNFDRFHCGHGIGISIYDPPIVTDADPTTSAFLMPDIKEGLLENMVLNIEVGYYVQGLMGFLYEDTMVVTSDGCRLLTRNSGSLDLDAFLSSPR